MILNRNTKISLSALITIGVILVIIGSLTIFGRQMTKLLYQYSQKNIFEVQDLYINTLEQQFNSLFDMLEAQARYFEGVNLKDDAQLKQAITKTKGIGSFKKIFVVNKNGVSTNYTGQNLANIRNKPYFIDLLSSGERKISNKIELDENLEPILTLLYPLKNNGKVEAVLAGTIPYNTLQHHFLTELFSGQSYTYIISNNENIVFCNKDKKKALYNINFYEYLANNTLNNAEEISEIKLSQITQKTGFVELSIQNTRKIFTYAPLNLNDWYIVTVLPVSYIMNQLNSISLMVIVLLVTIFVAAFVFLVVILLLFLKNVSVEKDKERLLIASNQNQTLIYEYDMDKKIIEFSGDTKFLLGTDKKVFPAEYASTEYFKRVHPDDKIITNQLIKAIRNMENDFSAEFRYKTFADEYIWLKMSGSIIKREGEPVKFIGSISNVNSQILHEQELKSIADKDRLTGVLNKSALEESIKSSLNANKNITSFALFIIDLDNFKAVNDKLGHLIGDMAIQDVAKKISLIFSEKDFIGRFGGDEFCVFLQLSNTAEEKNFQKIINNKLQTLKTILNEDYFKDNIVVHVSASIGVAIYPQHGINYQELFHNADHALYDVKMNGKDGYKIYSTK